MVTGDDDKIRKIRSEIIKKTEKIIKILKLEG